MLEPFSLKDIFDSIRNFFGILWTGNIAWIFEWIILFSLGCLIFFPLRGIVEKGMRRLTKKDEIDEEMRKFLNIVIGIISFFLLINTLESLEFI